ncbi:conserved hypothetical protein [Crenothrix polyspora]|uniref:Lysyl endopeptidase n=1 Tax=Crenothrix polyspora TaxID=360316 RepID=A0A1R4HCX6_9GAMM|nr:serine protease [Crenothrix polyspora]SJM94059.1 conserved hypothetical protein [Crenothrix polyspora]
MKAFLMKTKLMYASLGINTLPTSDISLAINTDHGLGKFTKSRINKRRYLLAAAFSLFTALPAHADSVGTVQQYDTLGKAANAPSAFLAPGTQAFNLNLPAMHIDLTPTTPGIHKTGVVHQLPTPVTAAQLAWQRVDGGYVAHIHLVSKQAKRLRYHLILGQKISSIVFRVKGNMDAAPLEAIDHSFIHDNNIWLPSTNGNKADLEIFVNDASPPVPLFSVDAIAVIVEDLNKGSSSGIAPKSVERAEKPEYDLACADVADEYPALQKAASATALIDFIENGEIVGACTGTLLNDKKATRTPWFATASHCISSQATANTAEFHWFYQAPSCGSRATDRRHKITRGAKLLWANNYLDAAFLKLTARPPNGVSFIGWSDVIKVGEKVWGVHHPMRDHTMVSKGKVTALRQSVTSDTSKHLLNIIEYITGGVELGSSGSGVFSVVKGSPIWKGTLWGMQLSDYQISYYSDFRSYYSKIKKWLDTLDNPDIEQFYKKYLAYFGKKSGENYVSKGYTYQNFVNGKIIALENTTKSLWWFDGTKWQQHR